MTAVRFPTGYRLARLQRNHPRASFDCGSDRVNDWLRSKADQAQRKFLSATTVLLDSQEAIAGYYTLALGQVEFSELPPATTRKLPKSSLPIAKLAWLGVHRTHQKRGLSERLIAQAMLDCYQASQWLPFVAVIVDCLEESLKGLYARWDFADVPANPTRVFLSASQLMELGSSQ
ncbi:MAG: N-acetyltransferase [Pirellulaceae bacterium]